MFLIGSDLYMNQHTYKFYLWQEKKWCEDVFLKGELYP